MRKLLIVLSISIFQIYANAKTDQLGQILDKQLLQDITIINEPALKFTDLITSTSNNIINVNKYNINNISYETLDDSDIQLNLIEQDFIKVNNQTLLSRFIDVNDKKSTLNQSFIIENAKKLMGIPYKWGGKTVRDGFDCSGLIYHLFNLVSIKLPRSSNLQAKDESLDHVNRNDLVPGDMVFFQTISGRKFSHVGLYVGNNEFLHAPKKGRSIKLDKLDNNYWTKRFSGARRSLELNDI